MALIFPGKSKCPLCDEIIQEGDKIVATSHFIADESDPLWIYSDAAMHKECFLKWGLRSEFVARYNEVNKKFVWGNGTYFQMDDDGFIRRIAAS